MHSNDEYTLAGMVLWTVFQQSIQRMALVLYFYNGTTEVSQINANADASHGASGGWKLQSIDVVVPEGVNGFKGWRTV